MSIYIFPFVFIFIASYEGFGVPFTDLNKTAQETMLQKKTKQNRGNETKERKIIAGG